MKGIDRYALRICDAVGGPMLKASGISLGHAS